MLRFARAVLLIPERMIYAIEIITVDGSVLGHNFIKIW